LRIAAPDHRRKIGEYEEKAESKKRLGQFLKMNATQEKALHDDADERDRAARRQYREHETAGFVYHYQADIAAEQIERTVSQVQDLH